MSLREDFFDLAYELAQFANKEIERIEKKAQATIKYYEKKTKKQIRKDVKKLEKTMMYDELYELNVNESEQVARIKQTVAEEKARWISDFISFLKKKIIQKIKKNPDPYYKFLNQKLKEFYPIINQNIIVYLNQRDLEYFKGESKFDIQQDQKFNIKIAQEPIDIIAGYKIKAEDLSFEIDFTLKSQIEKHREEFSMAFMKIFPIFEIDVKNATELEQEKFGGKKLS